MANHKRNRPPYRSTYSGYQANHSSPYYRRKQQEDESIMFIRRFMRQSMICLCLLMSVLVIQKLPNVPLYESVKSAMMGSFPFAKYEQMYQQYLSNMLPFEFRLPQTDDSTSLVSGTQGTTVDELGNPIEGEGTSTDPIFDVSQAINDAYNNMVLKDYENGVIIQIKQDEEIHSFVPGIVLNVGVDDKISNFMNIQLENEWTLTVGFLENRKVSQYQHIKVGDVLGVGSILDVPGTDFGDEAFYYLSLKDKEGQYQDIAAYLELLMQ
ncbi:peptidase M23 [Turicibacter bilis]|uniref:Peptidase M23 n=1 Tax=Turicibacter bilis TaxID=2735723 RepID=A0A9Q9CGK9_9FIRM|nr:peptidase M23 [Turicibacter bilis]MBS3198350.1 peptidase M23 [Turicibacter bilis]MBS3200994.1 peptidase M23 [Turicibacter bilis]UUF06935.1 peptidase M23 [Turicibacter bilis]UUF08163.1 peptidase M23 [Turicibacter bilis]